MYARANGCSEQRTSTMPGWLAIFSLGTTCPATTESCAVPVAEIRPLIAPDVATALGRYERVVPIPSATVPPLESTTVPRARALGVPWSEQAASELRRAKRPNSLSFIVSDERASYGPKCGPYGVVSRLLRDDQLALIVVRRHDGLARDEVDVHLASHADLAGDVHPG